MDKALGYIRVSTDEQTKGFGLDVQRTEIIGFAKKENTELAKIYEDAGYSGSEMDRPGLIEMLEASKREEIEKIIVYKTDRLARNNFMSWWIEKELKKNDVQLISVTEPYRLDDPSGRLFFAMISAFADYEREIIKMRMSAGRNQKARQGGYAGGNLSLGYYVKDGKLVMEKDEANIVRKVFREYSKGKSMSGLANELNNQKIKTKLGGKWHPATIQSILSNPLYADFINYKDIKVRGEHEPIVSMRLFNIVQVIRSRRLKRD